MRPSCAEVLAAVLAEPGGITTRRLAGKLATVPYQIQPNLSKLAAYGQITKTVISPRGDAVWWPKSSLTISLLPSSYLAPKIPSWRSSARTAHVYLAHQQDTAACQGAWESATRRKQKRS